MLFLCCSSVLNQEIGREERLMSIETQNRNSVTQLRYKQEVSASKISHSVNTAIRMSGTDCNE